MAEGAANVPAAVSAVSENVAEAAAKTHALLETTLAKKAQVDLDLSTLTKSVVPDAAAGKKHSLMMGLFGLVVLVLIIVGIYYAVKHSKKKAVEKKVEAKEEADALISSEPAAPAAPAAVTAVAPATSKYEPEYFEIEETEE